MNSTSTPQVVETILPGVGVKYELSTRSGTPLSLVVNREGGSVWWPMTPRILTGPR
ncbi:hypothetical protein [Ornithinimicrobium sp. INDO-MA30-4]|uniref:hypothetical protein n=1 Tax=Ornithinimicrobium sp. INDO-MA30-4 TaxID=2908651 RepID=UPI001F2AB484|nr:hypothetical protein [Ornithinimicrobium sp. INDO-MA30-4]UJH69800.1 hypothetical protein L0A91_11065 [Ornithinimicrobium sp. INDO-MA30-4]